MLIFHKKVVDLHTVFILFILRHREFNLQAAWTMGHTVAMAIEKKYNN